MSAYKVEICGVNTAKLPLLSEEEKEKLLKEKESLEASIARREKLLSNSNYVEKAPKAIVDKDREALLKEKEMLDIILNKINS